MRVVTDLADPRKLYHKLEVTNFNKEGFPHCLIGKESTYNAGELGSVPRSERFPGEGNPLQYSCLENSMDRRAWTERLSLSLLKLESAQMSFGR